MVNEFQRTKVQFLTTPPFARKYEPNNFFSILNILSLRCICLKFLFILKLFFLELTFIGSTSRHIQMTPAVMLNMIPNIKYTFCPVLNLF